MLAAAQVLELHAGRDRQGRLALHLEHAAAHAQGLVAGERDVEQHEVVDRDAGNGQAVTIGRLRPDAIFDYRFVCLSHNTVRGAAGGAVLTAELLTADGYLQAK